MIQEHPEIRLEKEVEDLRLRLRHRNEQVAHQGEKIESLVRPLEDAESRAGTYAEILERTHDLCVAVLDYADEDEGVAVKLLAKEVEALYQSQTTSATDANLASARTKMREAVPGWEKL